MSAAGRFNPAHPRSRGEHARQVLEELTEHGSSPLTRGAPSSIPDSMDHMRLIPAHAGSTKALSER